MSVRASVAAGLAVAIAYLAQLPFPLYALISAVLVTDLVPAQTRKLALPRLAGTILGAALGAMISVLLPHSAWTVGLGVLVSMLATHLLYLRDAVKVAGYVCGIVLLDHGEHPWSYALYRVIETGLGIAAAMLVSLVPKLINSDDSSVKDQPE